MSATFALGSSLTVATCLFFFFFSSRRRHTRFDCDWSSDVCSSDLLPTPHTASESPVQWKSPRQKYRCSCIFPEFRKDPRPPLPARLLCASSGPEIGRASCRERV